MITRRTAMGLIASGALALPGVSFAAAAPRVPPGQGGTPPGQAGNQGAGPGGGKMKNHKDGKTLLADNIKKNGNHGLGKAGKIDVSADVQGGKVVGFHAKHPDKGDLTVGKVKSTQKFAVIEPRQAPGEAHVETASGVLVWYYAYWFSDEFGNDWYYWFTVEYIIDDGSWVIYYA